MSKGKDLINSIKYGLYRMLTLLLHFYKWRMGSEPYMLYGFPSLSPLTDCYFYTSANGEWACNRVCLMVFLHCLH